MCDKFVDVKDFVANSCDGQQSCDILGTFKIQNLLSNDIVTTSRM